MEEKIVIAIFMAVLVVTIAGVLSFNSATGLYGKEEFGPTGEKWPAGERFHYEQGFSVSPNLGSLGKPYAPRMVCCPDVFMAEAGLIRCPETYELYEAGCSMGYDANGVPQYKEPPCLTGEHKCPEQR